MAQVLLVTSRAIFRILVSKVQDPLDKLTNSGNLAYLKDITDSTSHNLRYAIDSTKLQKGLGWEPCLQFEEGIEKTVKWYR